jgi:predicted nucleic acid-binding protein
LIVLDSSAVVQYFLQSARSPLISAAKEIAVPNHVFVEFLNATRNLEFGGKLSAQDAMDNVEAFLGLPLLHFETTEFAGEIWALRHNITPYDACYVCLARALQVPLVSADLKLLRAAEGLIEAIPFS